MNYTPTEEEVSEIVEGIQRSTAGMTLEQKWKVALIWSWMSVELARVLAAEQLQQTATPDEAHQT